MTEATPPQETNYATVYRMFIVEAVPRGEIFEHLSGRVSRLTVLKYIERAIKEAEANGIPFPFRDVKRPSGFASYDAGKPRSSSHMAIGAKLERFRAHSTLGPVAFCAIHRFANHVRLRRMELGLHDFTLNELQRIAELLVVPLLTLMEVPNPYASD